LIRILQISKFEYNVGFRFGEGFGHVSIIKSSSFHAIFSILWMVTKRSTYRSNDGKKIVTTSLEKFRCSTFPLRIR
jgi:hypothetical protein